MLYLFIGVDRQSKDKKIEELKAKLLPSTQSRKFDYDVLYAQRLDPDDLKKALIAYPAVAKKRLVIVHNCNKLSQHNKEIILKFSAEESPDTVVVLEADTASQRETFFNKIKKVAKTATFAGEKEIGAFDITNAISRRNTQLAIEMLSVVFKRGDNPLQIMGALVWAWNHNRNRMPLKRFKQGLTALQEADLNIKRSRIKPEYAVELAVIKLCT